VDPVHLVYCELLIAMCILLIAMSILLITTIRPIL